MKILTPNTMIRIMHNSGAYVTNLTSLRILAMRRIRRILTMRIMRALPVLIVIAPSSFTQA
jgi:hypothetical protein